MEYLDEKTAMAVERRRRMEEERKQRIFNEKVRSKGVCFIFIQQYLLWNVANTLSDNA